MMDQLQSLESLSNKTIADAILYFFPAAPVLIHSYIAAYFGESASSFTDRIFECPLWAALPGIVTICAVLWLLSRIRSKRLPKRASPQSEMAPPTYRVNTGKTQKDAVATALKACSTAFWSAGFFSGIINLLALTGSIFMLEVYDRVLPSRSVPTLVGLAIITGALFAFQGVLDVIRGRILVRIGASLDRDLSEQVYDSLVRAPLKGGSRNEGLQPLRDLDSLRSFLSGPGPTALFDLPWMPLYLFVIFAFHVYLGLVASVGAAVLIALTLSTEFMTRGPMRASTEFSISRHGIAETSRRNAEVLMAMGMAQHMCRRWSEANISHLRAQQRASDVTIGLGGLSKVFRLVLQSAVLGTGAYLVLNQEATAGIIIAGSILSARALMPVDQAIANWKGFVAARQSRQRLSKLLQCLSDTPAWLVLRPPKTQLTVESLTGVPPGTTKASIHDVSFVLRGGHGLGIVGPSASGKSSLARLLVGVWQPSRGSVRLDGATLDQWSPDILGKYIGYLPQDVELFPGTVAENISRFYPNASSETVIAAAEAAGVHQMIVGLADGYETRIGEQGAGLSSGQQQRIALARALYGDPFVIVLDEPNSNLDLEGEQALTRAILGVRARGGIVIVIAHREAALAGVDMLLTLVAGRAQLLGPKEEVMAKLRVPSQPATVVALAESARQK